MSFHKSRLVFLFMMGLLSWAGCQNNNNNNIGGVLPDGTFLPGLSSRPVNSNCFSFPPSNESGTLELTPFYPDLLFDRPIAMHQAPGDDTYWYVAEQEGRIYRITNQIDSTDKQMFLDLSPRFSYSFELFEHGMADFAFHPDFANNGKIYFYYKLRTADVPCNNFWPFLCPTRLILSEFTVYPDFNGVDPSSEKFLISLNTHTPIHLGGSIGFGPAGYLYVTLGENSNAHDAADVYKIFGKILRLDVDQGIPYGIPPDNPFYSGGGLPEIFAWGLRNPWRFSFDMLTGDLWAGDVGDWDWEEINKIKTNLNYGWPIFEGFACFTGPCDTPDLTFPKYVYSHDDGCSVTGGHVYRGSDIPELEGHYLFGDFCTGSVWIANVDGAEDSSARIVSSSDNRIVSFAQDIDGEVYLLDYFGKILKFTNYFSPQPSTIPNKLSETGCFNPEDPTVPNSGLIPYGVNVPLWSDGAEKDRWMALPPDTQIEILDSEKWKFPVGSVLVKNFKLNDHLIETRLLMQHDEDSWSGYSYEWDENQEDAYLVPLGGRNKFVQGQNWVFPSRTQCFHCHSHEANFVLGLETPQLNGLFHYKDTGIDANQLSTLASIGLFSNLSSEDLSLEELFAFPKWENQIPESSEIEALARSYLHINCAMCHQPGGHGIGTADFRYSQPLSEMGICLEPPTVSDLGIIDPFLIKPGVPEDSVVLKRMKDLGRNRMPPLSTFMVDTIGAQVIGDWIESLNSCEDI